MRSHCKIHSGILHAALAVLVTAASGPLAHSQIVPEYQGHSPVSQWHSPGTAARMVIAAGRANATWYQPTRIILDGGGDVTVFHSRPASPYKQASPAQFGTLVGQMYRMKLENMPGLPGVEVYPTVEVLDRLHPPRGQKHNFPVEIHIDRDDVDLALSGNLVTKVVYLEQPNLAAPFELDEATRTRSLDKMDNALTEADRFGRPMAIIRIGGRVPSAHSEPQTFWGSGAPVAISKPLLVPDDSQPQAVYNVRPQTRDDRLRAAPQRKPARIPAMFLPPNTGPAIRPASRPASKVAIPRRKAGQP
jgi:hypothetical protein